MDKILIKKIILATLVADSYSLGAHWVYDEKNLKRLDIDWEELNSPQAIWHKGKKAGDFTHYGDKTIWLYDFVKSRKNFLKDDFIRYLVEKFQTYQGYMDSASRDSLVMLEKGKDEGSNSDDFSIIGQIVPLLMVSKNEDEFFNNVAIYIKLTHNSDESLKAGNFFAKLLLLCLKEGGIEKNIDILEKTSSKSIQQYIQNAKENLSKKSFNAIRDFGPACGTNEAFVGTIYLLLKYKSLKELLIKNAQAGGDSSARGMVASMIYVSTYKKHDLPKAWFNLNRNIT